MGKVVTLSWFEVFQVACVGAMRQIEALKRGRNHRHGFEGDSWGVHIEGAGAEAAVAKARGRYWEAVVTDPATLEGDVGRLQVRSTAHDNGHLIVYRDDPDDAPFILVIGAIPRFKIVGWIYGRDAKQDRFWRASAREPTFFVPQVELKPLPE